MDAQGIARACADKLWQGDRVRQALGMDLAAIGPGAATVSMRVRRDMLNAHEMCHGGMIFTLADAALSYASNSQDATSLAQNCSIVFLAPGRLDDTLTATAREVARPGRTGVYDVRVTRQDGTTIAEFRGMTRTTGGSIIDDGWRKPAG